MLLQLSSSSFGLSNSILEKVNGKLEHFSVAWILTRAITMWFTCQRSKSCWAVISLRCSPFNWMVGKHEKTNLSFPFLFVYFYVNQIENCFSLPHNNEPIWGCKEQLPWNRKILNKIKILNDTTESQNLTFVWN